MPPVCVCVSLPVCVCVRLCVCVSPVATKLRAVSVPASGSATASVCVLALPPFLSAQHFQSFPGKPFENFV